MKHRISFFLGVVIVGCTSAGGDTTTIALPEPTSTSTTTIPATTTSTLPLDNEPLDIGPLAPRRGHSVVWTGEEMIVWGGEADELGRELFSDGAAFNPESGTWRMLSESPLDPRRYHMVAWTGGEMIVVGGVGEDNRIAGRWHSAAYRPQSDTWRLIAFPPISVGAPSGTEMAGFLSSVWTGEELIVWNVLLDLLAAYDPEEDRWHSLPATGLGVTSGVLRWNRESLYAFARKVNDYPAPDELLVIRLAGNEWKPLPPVDFSTDNYRVGVVPHLTAWAGDRFLAWSDSGRGGRTMAFDPVAGTWSETDRIPSPSCEGQGEPISAEGVVFAFGWCGPNLGMLDIETQTWSEAAVGGSPTARYTVWTGHQLINWGDTCCYGSEDKIAVNVWMFRPND